MIRELLKRLSRVQMQQLRYAHEQEIAQYIELDDDIFIGVNVEPIPYLIIEERAGDWACGRVNRGHH